MTASWPRTDTVVAAGPRRMDTRALVAAIDELRPFYEESPGHYEDWLLHHRQALIEGTDGDRQRSLRWIRAGLRSF